MMLEQILTKIDNIKAKLDAALSFTEGELARFREHFMVEYTYNSNAIDGNNLTLSETALVVFEGLTIYKKPLKCHIEAVGHRDGFNYIIDAAKSKGPLTELTIKEIRAIVLMDRPHDRDLYMAASRIMKPTAIHKCLLKW